MSSSQMARLEPIASKLDALMSIGLMGFGTYESLQHQIPIDMPIEQMGFVSNDLGSQFSLVPTQQGGNTKSLIFSRLPQQQQGGNTESQTYNQLPQQQQGGNIGSQTYNQHQQGGNIGSQTYTQLPQQQLGGNIGSQTFTQLPQQQQGGNIDSQTFTQLPQQQQGEIVPTMLNSRRQHLLPPLNKRKAPSEPISPISIPQMLSLPNKRVAQMEHRPWLQPIFKKSVCTKCPPPKVQKESFESVKSKMRENLAGAPALVSQKQGENATVEKKSNGEAVEPQGTLLSNRGGSADGNNNNATQTLQYDGQQLHKSISLPDEGVPFSDNIFAGKWPWGNGLGESVVSGDIPPERLCSMSAEELASKELSQWRQAKAEELAQMVVLPDVQVDIRRLVRKTHKGEVQVEVEQTDSSAVEISAGISVTQRPKPDSKQASKNDNTVGKKDESDDAGKKNNPEVPNLTITIPSSEGPDPMQGLMGEDELKDADILPPIVSLDEFMKSLDSEPPFENIPGDAGKAASTSDKDDS
ncbi:hypothetical protein F3Y22_tig00110202pilonHSYRG00070 [Hibiscus syriacus]|uniref:TFIIS central domain-containing protein n=1 Tax=Hibiscus syriacus TaxID=106335 RepID=A0A6A3BAI3_HIBSY|nr:hypothetical protein F3Y22_tig00110202pilonHSYRG00070 [Hibiscus syriacus]